MERRTLLGLLGAAPLAPSLAHAAVGTTDAGAAPQSVRVPLDDPDITVTENIWIPMEDGTKLAARLFLPANAGEKPCGVVLEYLPYRKRDGYRYRDDIVGPFFAKAGIGFIRVDIRGTGDSEGVMVDEYEPPEQDDALVLLDWIASQSWCNGSVGMRGISYGSFNGLQAAAKAPPALKAIVSACGTDQRYLDDIHYRGGCLIDEQWTWAMEWQVIMKSPPDPLIVGEDRWRDMWMERLDVTFPLTIDWNSHQTNDAKWQYGSISDFGKITAAIYNVGGMLDSYVPSVTRMMEKAPQVPQKGLIGPWAHKWPGYPLPEGHEGPVPFGAEGKPGPGVDWLPQEVRWWLQTLNGEDTGILNEPDFATFRQDMPAAYAFPKDTVGAYVTEPSWPSPNVTPHVLHLNSDGLSESAGDETVLEHGTCLTHGFANRFTDSSGSPDTWWREQSSDDAQALCFDSEVLTAPVDMIGEAKFKIRVRADRPVAKLYARLTEVTPDGKSHFVTFGLLNLTHRDSHEFPELLEPGKDYDVEFPGQFSCYRFSPGNRIRVALSEVWWPCAWPSPEMVTLGITAGVSRVEIPTRPTGIDTLPPFTVLHGRYDDPDAEPAPYLGAMDGVEITGEEGSRLFTLVEGSKEVEESFVPGPDTYYGEAYWLRRAIREDDPNSAEMEAEAWNTFRRGDWNIKLRAWSRSRSTTTHLLCEESFEAWEGDKLVFSRTWEKDIPRNML